MFNTIYDFPVHKRVLTFKFYDQRVSFPISGSTLSTVYE